LPDPAAKVLEFRNAQGAHNSETYDMLASLALHSDSPSLLASLTHYLTRIDIYKGTKYDEENGFYIKVRTGSATYINYYIAPEIERLLQFLYEQTSKAVENSEHIETGMALISSRPPSDWIRI
jgi:hypothetical protein